MVKIIDVGCRVRISQRLPTFGLVYNTVFSRPTDKLLNYVGELKNFYGNLYSTKIIITIYRLLVRGCAKYYQK